MSASTASGPAEAGLVLGTAGHIDHGKTALVRALTGVDTDRLPEEKRRGITIDLGFSQWSLVDPEQPQITYDLGMIDVPGHEDFVKNMVTGVGSIDCALLVIAADDGWMPQTEEHFQILCDLGVERVIVVLNKIDLAADDEAFLVEVIRDELKETVYAEVPIVATSTMTDPGFIDLTISRVTSFGAAAPGIKTPPTTKSASRTCFSTAS